MRTYTFLFTDIEGSTRLLQELAEGYHAALEAHHRIIRRATARHHGTEVRTQGDSFFLVFDDPADAVSAATEAQLELQRHSWPDGGEVRVRMGVHTGLASVLERDFVGMAVHEAARLSDAAHGGQLLLSMATERALGGRLPEGAELRHLGRHRLKDLPDPVSVFQVVHPALRAEFPRLRSLGPPSNLPAATNSFVGRHDDLRDLAKAMERTRLLTLLGPAGIGKSRLALEFGRSLLDAGLDGVWMVELAATERDDLVPAAVAAAVDIPERGGRDAVASLEDFFAGRDAVLLVDNCEHLLDGVAGLVERLLGAAPGLRVLATSREALETPAEAVHEVSPLAVPGRDEVHPEALAASDAVRLFCERTAARHPAFELDHDTAPLVARICTGLDGLPLAIELAAAQVRPLGLDRVAGGLSDRLSLLSRGARTAPPRQRSLSAAVEWSYDLLTEPERVLFERLSVQAGTWPTEAAVAVGATDGVPAEEVPALVERLADRSLVQRRGQGRYLLLETLRAFGFGKLSERGTLRDALEAHVRWAAERIGTGRWEDSGTDQAAWAAGLADDHDNLQAAVSAALEIDPPKAAELAARLSRYWELRGHLDEGRLTLEKALDRHAPPGPVRARVLLAAGRLAAAQADVRAADELLNAASELADDELRPHVDIERALLRVDHKDAGEAARLARTALAGARDASDEAAEARAMRALVVSLRQQGKLDEAEEFSRQAVSIARRLGDEWLLAGTLDDAASLAWRTGRLEEARRHLEEELELARKLGNDALASYALSHLGMVATAAGDPETACAFYEQAVELAQRVGDQRSVAASLSGLARALNARGRLDDAASMLRQSIDIRVRQGVRSYVPVLVEELARLVEELGDARRGALLLGAAAAGRESVGRPADDEPPDALPKELHAEWRRGRTLTFEEMVAEAVRDQ